MEIAEMEKGDRTNLVDMNELALHYYFHPLMKGRSSIKVTLSAALKASKSERIKKWLTDEELYAEDDSGEIINPYKLLPESSLMYDGKSIKISDGSAAMTCYKDMLYGLNKNDEGVKKIYVESLKKYCKLDTWAMIIIWERWSEMKNAK